MGMRFGRTRHKPFDSKRCFERTNRGKYCRFKGRDSARALAVIPRRRYRTLGNGSKGRKGNYGSVAVKTILP